MFLAAVSQYAWAAISITTVADVNNLPTLGTVSTPALKNGNVAFISNNVTETGLYTWTSGTLTTVADTTTAVPGSTGTFTASDFRLDANSSIDANGDTVFNAYFNVAAGIYNGVYDTTSGSLQPVADTSTVAPDTGLNFARFDINTFGASKIDDGRVVFIGGSGTIFNPIFALYTNVNGSLETVANVNTLMPGTAGTFAAFVGMDISGDSVAFYGTQGSFGNQGIYLWDANTGMLSTVADLTTGCLSGPGTLDNISGFVDLDGQSVVFGQGGGPCSLGIYTNARGPLELVADTSTATPGDIGTLMVGDVFGNGASLDNGRIVFCARDSVSDVAALFMWENGSLSRLFGEGDVIDGKIISSLGGFSNCAQGFGTNALDGDELVFYGSVGSVEGIYLADLDAPATPVPAAIEVQPEAPFTALHPQHDGNLGPQGIAAFPDDPIGVVVFTQSTAAGDPVDLDATDIDPNTLAFGPGGGAINPASTPDFSQDIDNDGLNDARFSFLMSDAAIACSDTEAQLTGALSTGDGFAGVDAVTSDCNAQCHN